MKCTPRSRGRIRFSHRRYHDLVLSLWGSSLHPTSNDFRCAKLSDVFRLEIAFTHFSRSERFEQKVTNKINETLSTFARQKICFQIIDSQNCLPFFTGKSYLWSISTEKCLAICLLEYSEKDLHLLDFVADGFVWQLFPANSEHVRILN